MCLITRTCRSRLINQLREHFAPVLGHGERDRHLRYYLASVDEARKYDELIRRGDKPTPAQTRLGRQMEKDERFWLATALMSLYHADGGFGRGELFARLLERARLRLPPGFPRWEDALAGVLDLFFEVNLPSPGRYRAWLRAHLGERAPIPYLKEQAEARGARLEGATRASQVPARGLQPPPAPGDDPAKFDPIHPTASSQMSVFVTA